MVSLTQPIKLLRTRERDARHRPCVRSCCIFIYSLERTKRPSAPAFVSGHSEKPAEEFRPAPLLSRANPDLPDDGEKSREIKVNYGSLNANDLLAIRSFNEAFDDEMRLKSDGDQVTVLLKEIDIDKLRRFVASFNEPAGRRIVEDVVASIKETLLSFKQAAKWAAAYTNSEVTASNISYLVQYGRVRKYGDNGTVLVDKEELKRYYDSFDRERRWKEKLGDDLNWRLSFSEYREKERTKHVHRLHPYKGKFIPQLVEYFLDGRTDEFKKEVYFREGDIVLDPFCGSGTTLVQANELGMHAVGIDVSLFNCMIANAKVEKRDVVAVAEAVRELTMKLEIFQEARSNLAFERELLTELGKFNSEHFPSPEYRRKVSKGEIEEREYAAEKEREFLSVYSALLKKYRIETKQKEADTFLDIWFLPSVREEIDFLFRELERLGDEDVKKILRVVLSRVVRSCRATTHADLGTLKDPVTDTYYCKKHGKMCKPIFSVAGWWKRYTEDTLKRLNEFGKIRTETFQRCLAGDSRKIDVFGEMKKRDPGFGKLLSKRKIRGIFSSPPYVGLIDYHQQHAYAYEIFGFRREDELEIGPLFKGQGKEARDSYAAGIAEVLGNCRKYMQKDYDVFLVANDKHDLYPDIAERADMEIVNRFKRPVLNRVEKDRSTVYAETIFHLKGK